MKPRRRETGTSYIEAIVSLALLGIVLTTSFTVLDMRRAYLRALEERAHVLHAIEKELESARSFPFDELTPRVRAPFTSETTELGTLLDADARLTIDDTGVPGLRRARASVSWGRKIRHSLTAETLLTAVPLRRARVDGAAR